jgi:hypothetical protein
VLDVIFSDGSLFQFGGAGGFKLGSFTGGSFLSR